MFLLTTCAHCATAMKNKYYYITHLILFWYSRWENKQYVGELSCTQNVT